MKLLFLLFLSCSVICSGQTINRSIMGSGGGNSTNGTTTLRGTVSQTAIGRIAQSQVNHAAGFWYNASQIMRSSGFGSVVVLPSVEALIGQSVKVPLILEQSSHLLETSARTFTAVITFNASLLEPIGSKYPYKRSGNKGELTISGTITDTAGVLAEMEFTSKLGDAESTPLTIQSFLWNETNRVKIITKNGDLHLTGICEAGDTARLIKRANAASLIRVYPNPAVTISTIEYQLSERGATSVYLVDAQGQTLAPLYQTSTAVPGHFSFDTDVALIPSGSYFLILKTPNEIFSKRFMIER